jgi:hypothetical protein
MPTERLPEAASFPIDLASLQQCADLSVVVARK